MILKKLGTLRKKLNLEVIFVDDSSTDRTFSIGKKLAPRKAIRHSENYGKGAAIRTGIKHSTGDVLVIQDADLEYPPENIPKIVDPIIRKQADAVYGSRLLDSNDTGMKVLHVVGNKILSAVASVLYGTRISDVMTGHKAFRKKAVDSLTLTRNGFEIEVEITAKLLLSRSKLVEVPVSYHTRERGRSKIGLRHGFTSLMTLVMERVASIGHSDL